MAPPPTPWRKKAKPRIYREAHPLDRIVDPKIARDDLDAFEKLLDDIQTAFSRGDIDELGAISTPEMLSYFSEELANNAKRGVRNEISNVKLLQGDVSEAWRENGSDYATVAMRFSLVDAIVDEANGHLVSGDRTRPTEATELWTFRREVRAHACRDRLRARSNRVPVRPWRE